MVRYKAFPDLSVNVTSLKVEVMHLLIVKRRPSAKYGRLRSGAKVPCHGKSGFRAASPSSRPPVQFHDCLH
jgi:hypothetical protein